MAEENDTPKQTDIYDEEFHNNLKLAKALMSKIPTEAEKNICRKWIMKLMQLKSKEPAVKRNRNHFFRYLLSVMNKGTWGLTHTAEHHGFPQFDAKFADQTETGANQFLCRWSGDRKTYVATKPIPGKGALVYMAVAKEPKLGWDNPQDRTT
ncbi:uncharacterized protein LOC123681821 [Harmonia axyridis]|uniref:uncharacterized protein LOC123681821 n=1 Tax=Harmonia axyridis TaxID=115357 RepID=UPI001E276F72|nr:uncharacterized protein LOC123681821 [Harmonia axyridis]